MGPLVKYDASDERLAQMRERMAHFYATFDAPFKGTVSRENTEYPLLNPLFTDLLRTRETIRVLELGANRTGLPDYLRSRSISNVFDTQDIEATSLEHSNPLIRKVHVGDVDSIEGAAVYDFILSTYVIEHVPNPPEFLCHVKRLLSPGGWHVIFCPRYDLPFYTCPSLRHLPTFQRWKLGIGLAASRMASRLDGKPRFWINSDPSALHEPWTADKDAVHIVGRFDLEQWHRFHGFSVRRLKLPYTSWRTFILYRWMTVSIACQKPA